MYKIKSLHIENVRAIKSATVRFADGITVLIGENGAGKSTILECLEILRKIPSGRFMDDLYEQHGGLRGLLLRGASDMKLQVSFVDESEVEVTSDEGEHVLKYFLHLRLRDDKPVVVREVLELSNYMVIFDRNELEVALYTGFGGGGFEPHKLGTSLFVAAYGYHPPSMFMEFLMVALASIEVQLRFDTLARWAAVATNAPSPLRGSSQERPTNRLDLLGRNLANAWRVLLAQRVGEAFDHVMYLVRMGLGEDVERVEIVEDPSGGQVGLALRRAGLPEPIQAFMLSDGQLAWLAFVAMVQLNEGRSILAVDEPELHMHPYLINAAVALLQTVEAPVVIATHSDHILSMLEDPVAAVRVCALEDGAAVVRELDAAAFEEWRRAYTDMGQLRASGFLEHVLKREG